MKLQALRQELVVGLLVVAALILGILFSPSFADADYLLESSTLFIEWGLLTLGLTLVIGGGNIDLSPASNLALCGCATAKLCAMGLSPVFSATCGVLLGLALGLFNGLLVAYAALPSFLVTLATLALFRGIAQALMGAESVPIPASLAGVDRIVLAGSAIPASLCLFLVCAIAVSLVLRKTVFGRQILAIGANPRAAELSAVPVRRVAMLTFGLLGGLAGLCGVLMISRLGVARFDHARGLELEAITAVVLGGTLISGGKATVLGSALAVLLVAVVRTSLGLADIKFEIQMMVVGIVLIAALAFSGTKRVGWLRSANRQNREPSES